MSARLRDLVRRKRLDRLGAAVKYAAYHRPGCETPSEEGFVYHATNEDGLQGIVEAGHVKTFRPWHGTDQREWPDGSTEKRSYWSKHAGHVWQFAPEDGNPVIIRTRLSDRLRRETTGDYYSTKKIPASDVEVMTDDGEWKPLADPPRDRPDQPTLFRRLARAVKYAASESDLDAVFRAIHPSVWRGETYREVMPRLVAADALDELGRPHEATLMRQRIDGSDDPALPLLPVYLDNGVVRPVAALRSDIETHGRAGVNPNLGMRPMLSREDRDYLEAALGSTITGDEPEGGYGQPLDANYGIGDIHPATLAQMVADNRHFHSLHGHLIGDAAHSGHDFWLTRNGHGVGFWSHPETYGDNADDLTDAAHRFGEYDLHVGDDGMIHGPHNLPDEPDPRDEGMGPDDPNYTGGMGGAHYRRRYDLIPGGKGDRLSPRAVSKRQLLAGIRVEMEHTRDPKVAREIALDHLAETPDYYTKLKQVERHARVRRYAMAPQESAYVTDPFYHGLLEHNGDLTAWGALADKLDESDSPLAPVYRAIFNHMSEKGGLPPGYDVGLNLNHSGHTTRWIGEPGGRHRIEVQHEFQPTRDGNVIVRSFVEGYGHEASPLHGRKTYGWGVVPRAEAEAALTHLAGTPNTGVYWNRAEDGIGRAPTTDPVASLRNALEVATGRPLDPDRLARRYAAYRAPAGGTVVRGNFYKGGSLIPDLTKFLPPEKLDRLKKRVRARKVKYVPGTDTDSVVDSSSQQAATYSRVRRYSMASDHAAFQQAILENPTDLTTRQVYADYLDENDAGAPGASAILRNHTGRAVSGIHRHGNGSHNDIAVRTGDDGKVHVDFTKTVFPAIGDRRALLYKIVHVGGRLSITGRHGQQSYGQLHEYLGYPEMRPVRGWTKPMMRKFQEVARRWHLNDMRSGTPAQMEYLRSHPTSDYDETIRTLTEAGLNPDPETGHRYGHAWLREEVPAEVLDFLTQLPSTDRTV